jgi:hypothetical protein
MRRLMVADMETRTAPRAPVVSATQNSGYRATCVSGASIGTLFWAIPLSTAQSTNSADAPARTEVLSRRIGDAAFRGPGVCCTRYKIVAKGVLHQTFEAALSDLLKLTSIRQRGEVVAGWDGVGVILVVAVTGRRRSSLRRRVPWARGGDLPAAVRHDFQTTRPRTTVHPEGAPTSSRPDPRHAAPCQVGALS